VISAMMNLEKIVGLKGYKIAVEENK